MLAVSQNSFSVRGEKKEKVIRTKTVNTIKAWSMHFLSDIIKKHKGLQVIQRPANMKYDDSNYIIRFDLLYYTTFPDSYMALGDVCNITENSYNFAISQGEANRDFRNENPLSFLVRENGEYVVLAFIELQGKNCKDIFCIITKKNSPNDDMLVDGIVRHKKSGKILLFWPERLTVIKREDSIYD